MPKGILNKASLVMVPEAPIDGTMPSVFPEDRSGDFTFTRGSNLSATRIASNGLIEKGRENLLLQSNTFSNVVWADNAGSCARTSGQLGYDGSNDAWLLTQNSAGYPNILQSVSSSGVNTYSVYAKGSSTAFTLRIANTGDRVLFDLNAGSVASTLGSNLIDYGMSDAGGGWYRCYLTSNTTITGLNIYPYFNSTTATSVTIQDAQLEVGLVATDYIESGVTTGTAGLLENEPRIDFTGGGCGALLLEPQRTNIFDSSEYLTSVDSDLTQSVSDVDSPISGVPYLKLLKSNSGVARIIKEASAGVYTYSVFGKQGSTNGNTFSFSDSYYGGSTLNVQFNLTTGAFIGTPSGNGLINADFEDFGDGSYRVWVTYNHDPASTGTEVRKPAIFLDNGYLNVGEYIYLTGFQVEAGSYPTSYIPTYGSSVTRSNEFVDATSFSSILPSNAFTLLFEFSDTKVGTGSGYIYRMDITSTSSDLDLYQNPFGTGGLNVHLPSQGAYIFGTSNNDAWGVDASKVAISYDGDRLAYFINGTLYNSATGIVFSGDTKPNFRVSNSSPSYKLDKYVSFPTALSDEECSALTQP